MRELCYIQIKKFLNSKNSSFEPELNATKSGSNDKANLEDLSVRFDKYAIANHILMLELSKKTYFKILENYPSSPIFTTHQFSL